MKINTANVSYSSIVQIGEDILNLEKETGEKYLKLHRGVMDVTTLKTDFIPDLNSKILQQYSGNDGYTPLIENIKIKFQLEDSHIIITPGGMAALDLIINSLSEDIFWIPNLHWGSWNKILKTHHKKIETFDDFKLDFFRPEKGVVMLCFPSNPTGYSPTNDEIEGFLNHTKELGITVILDLPYYHLFNEKLNFEIYDNVVLLSSFSKSIGLSGYRIGYIATKNQKLYETLRIRSLYKYNSISTLPQYIINELLINDNSIKSYKEETVDNIEKNINFLKERNLLYSDYTKTPIGPFAIINIDYDTLLKYKISSVPLNKFTINGGYDGLSRISVAVNHEIFIEYFDSI